MSEDPILQDVNVTITKTLAIVNGVSYPTNTISAISVKELQPKATWLIWTILLGIAALAALSNGAVMPGLVAAAIAAVIIYFRPKVEYSLMVRSAGADTSVLTSRDASYLGSVKAAIEEAVRLRG